MDNNELYAQAFQEYRSQNYDAALRILDELKILDPNYKSAYSLESLIWHAVGNPVKEFSTLKNILPQFKNPSSNEKNIIAKILTNMGNSCSHLNMVEEALNFYHLSAQFADNEKIRIAAIDNSFMAADGSEKFSRADFQALHDEYKKFFADIVPYPKKFYKHKKIRIGFLSGDFKNHAAMNWSWALLTRLDKNFFKTHFYSNSKTSYNVTNYLRSIADGWRDIFDLTDEDVAKIIRDDEIDILFDLSGHTAGNRLSVAAYRPASVQISGIGYMNSTGLDAIDYFLSDVYCAGNPKYFTEKIIKMPHSHICYEPPSNIEPAANPPCIKNNFVTFGCFNKFNKVTDTMLNAWKKILDAVPNSRLILKHKIFNTVDGKNFVSERLKSFGFDLSRIEMRPYSSDYLKQYADIDIALDTFPYTGGVTTCEALYMGVPVISLYGDRHGTRFGLSILSNVGLGELAVDSYDEYIKRAVALANDWDLLTILRKNLRTMMKKSPLMDAEGYVRDIEKVFIKILNDEREKFLNG